jgi:hypothetical protein
MWYCDEGGDGAVWVCGELKSSRIRVRVESFVITRYARAVVRDNWNCRKDVFRKQDNSSTKRCRNPSYGLPGAQ